MGGIEGRNGRGGHNDRLSDDNHTGIFSTAQRQIGPAFGIDKINAAVNEAVKRPDIVKLWTQQGAVPMSMTPEAFDKFLRGDIVKWAEVVKKFDKPQ